MRTLIFPKVLEPLMAQALSELDSPDIVTYTGVTQDDLMQLHFDHRARLIITRPDLPGISCDRMVHVIRRNDAVSKVSIMLLVAENRQDIERARTSGANVMLPLSTPAQELGRKIEELLDIPPRRSYHVPLNMTLEGDHGNKPFLCNMENISSHGMLIRTTRVMALGDRVSGSFHLPLGRQISITGSIVRAISGTDDDLQHRYGVHFEDLSREDRSALSSFVNQERGHGEASGNDKKTRGE
jgi:hypothetical protein